MDTMEATGMLVDVFARYHSTMFTLYIVVATSKPGQPALLQTHRSLQFVSPPLRSLLRRLDINSTYTLLRLQCPDNVNLCTIPFVSGYAEKLDIRHLAYLADMSN